MTPPVSWSSSGRCLAEAMAARPLRRRGMPTAAGTTTLPCLRAPLLPAVAPPPSGAALREHNQGRAGLLLPRHSAARAGLLPGGEQAQPREELGAWARADGVAPPFPQIWRRSAMTGK
jgi:hypothetical protein